MGHIGDIKNCIDLRSFAAPIRLIASAPAIQTHQSDPWFYRLFVTKFDPNCGKCGIRDTDSEVDPHLWRHCGCRFVDGVGRGSGSRCSPGSHAANVFDAPRPSSWKSTGWSQDRRSGRRGSHSGSRTRTLPLPRAGNRLDSARRPRLSGCALTDMRSAGVLFCRGRLSRATSWP